jgi:hypothetical protein
MCNVERAGNRNKVLDGILFSAFQTGSCIGFHYTSEILHQLSNILPDIASKNDDRVRGTFDFFWLIPILLGLVPLNRKNI